MRLFEFEDNDLVLETEHDFRGFDFVYYDTPVDHYNIKTITKKIQSFEELIYYSEVLFYLNPDIDLDLLKGIFRYVGTRDSGKSVRTYGKARIEYAIEKAYSINKKPWCRRLRRVVFNPEKIISKEEKLAVVAHITKRSPSFTKQDLERSIENLRTRLQVITISKLSKELVCSQSTVTRILEDYHKTIIKQYNMWTRKELKIRILVQNIELLTSNGDPIKVRALKEMTSIRDYALIKEAMNRFLEGY